MVFSRLVWLISFMVIVPSSLQAAPSLHRSGSEESFVYNLDDSIEIILNLIYCNGLSKIIDDADPDQIKDLIKNFSPAELAFESEVLNCNLPVVVHFFHNENADLHQSIENLAQEFNGHLKIVAVNAKKLFRIARKAEILFMPTIMFVNGRKEVNRIEGNATYEEIRLGVVELLNKRTDEPGVVANT